MNESSGTKILMLLLNRAREGIVIIEEEMIATVENERSG
jgi:hypothetical protein